MEKKVNDKSFIWLVRKVLNNFQAPIKGRGMPLGNYTSQFFANVYLNELDYFIKKELKAKYYIRYVDDFVILHRNKIRLEYFRKRIDEFLSEKLCLKLHPNKSDIFPLRNGITFLGYKVFYKNKLLRKRNKKYFLKNLDRFLRLYENGDINESKLIARLQGWFGYAEWANTYLFRKGILDRVHETFLKKGVNNLDDLTKLLKRKSL